MWFGEPFGQGWAQLGELTMAFGLSALIGLEREIRQKSAGLRTYTLVGVAAALIMLVSKYGFTDVLNERVILDPSRIAAQIVTGIGFIGGGLIFVRRDNVRGLTTAAIVWLTAAVGMACGAGLPVLAAFVTALHFVVIFLFSYIVARLPHSRWTPSPLQVTYEDGRGLLREILVACTQYDFAVSGVRVERDRSPAPEGGATQESPASPGGADRRPPAGPRRLVSVILEIQGTRSVAKLAAKLAEIDGVASVRAGDVNVQSD
jgi:putative Mg2+ transporter-C (MgtC) family protein